MPDTVVRAGIRRLCEQRLKEIAEGFPTSRITAVSNSRSQRAWILGEARRRGLGNVELITADMNQFDAGSARFGRAVAVEMFEHMRNWLSRQFFAGGMMPSDELALRFQDALRFLRRWRWNGRHYEKTANAWLANVDARRAAVLPVLAATYGDAGAEQWLQRWRIFFMACAELFGHRNGQEWWVSHYLFERPAR